MKKLLPVALALFLAAPAQSKPYQKYTNEVLVLASAAVRVDTDHFPSRRGVEIQNHGPNTIWCAFGAAADAVVLKAHAIVPGGVWGLGLQGGIPVYCRAATADQIADAATGVTEMP